MPSYQTQPVPPELSWLHANKELSPGAAVRYSTGARFRPAVGGQGDAAAAVPRRRVDAVKGYGFVDYLTQGYLAVVAGLLVGFHNQTVPGWAWLVAGHAGVMLLIHGLIRAHGRGQPGPVLDFLRHFYPVLLYTGFYRETAVLNRMFQSDYLDPVVIRWEQALFGGQPSVQFMEWLPWRAASELFYAAYFSYYVMIVGVGLTLLLRRRDQFHHYVSVISFVFYVCYLIYIFVPVTGPRAFFREVRGYRLPAEVQALVGSVTYPEAVTQGVFFRIMAIIYDIFEAPGAALPSSHVAVAVATAWFSFRYLPRIRFWHLGTVFLLCLSTVYCRYHYVTDVLAGLLTAAVLVPLGHWLYERCAGTASRPAQACGCPADRSADSARPEAIEACAGSGEGPRLKPLIDQPDN